ncbi:hypothetical protein BH10PSE18_BH10PSE18_34090 [soil metagenome]|jgi:uncharacterized membrane protein
MFGLTPLGLAHTAISLVALAAGIAALIRFGEIPARHVLGRTYIWATVMTCLTGFGIFRHGGFGAPHALGVLTLLVLAVAVLVGIKPVFGRASRYIETIAYSVTLFFHMIPGLTETFTRLPVAAPLFTGPDDPALQKVIGVFFLLLLIGCALQARRLHAGRAPWQPAAPVL